jgi:hypothetical protein
LFNGKGDFAPINYFSDGVTADAKGDPDRPATFFLTKMHG